MGASVYKIVAAVVFLAMLANVINLGVFYRGSSVEINSSLLQSGTQLSKVLNRINLPVKIIGDLFKSEKVANSGKTDVCEGNDKVAVIVKQGNRINAELSKKSIYIPANELKILHIVPIDTGQSGSPGHLFLYGDFIMTLLLILLLISLLPRGIPSRKINKIDIFMRPVFMPD